MDQAAPGVSDAATSARKGREAAENPPHHLDVLSYLNGANSALAHVREVEKALEAKKKALDDWWGTSAPG